MVDCRFNSVYDARIQKRKPTLSWATSAQYYIAHNIFCRSAVKSNAPMRTRKSSDSIKKACEIQKIVSHINYMVEIRHNRLFPKKKLYPKYNMATP